MLIKSPIFATISENFGKKNASSDSYKNVEIETPIQCSRLAQYKLWLKIDCK